MRILLIGPLPPPHGGSRVSFARFCAYLERLPGVEVTHVDLPIRKLNPDGEPGGVAAMRTAIGFLAAASRVPFHDRIILFSSRGSAFTFGLFIVALSWLAGKPVALRLFGGRPYAHAASRRGIAQILTEWILSKAFSISLETETGRRDFPPELRTKVKVVPGYRARVNRPEPVTRHEGSIFDFVYAGRVDASKGIDVLIQACRTLANEPNSGNFRVDCYGASSDEIATESRSCPQVRLMGVIENSEYLRKLGSYDAFVYPSVYDNEGHPGAIIEAMQSGLPIICTGLETVMEIVSDGVEGLVVEPGNANELAAAMSRLIKDPILRSGLGAGSDRKGHVFDEEVVLPTLLKEMGLGELLP